MKESSIFRSCRVLAFAGIAAVVSFDLRAEAVDIGDAVGFCAIADNPGGGYRLTADIDLSGAGYVSIPEFSGTLDGAGHTLYGLGTQPLCVTNSGSVVGLTIDGERTTWSQTDVGVFCCVSFGGRFTDCVVKGYTLKHKDAGAMKQNGLFAATAYEGSTFVRCATDATCSMDQIGKSNNLQGGFVGQLAAINPAGVVATFEDCTNNASIAVTGDYNTGWGAGGFVGKIQNMTSASVPEVAFLRCVNRGSLTATGDKGNVGGIVGHLSAAVNNGATKDVSARARFVHCVNEGALSAASNSKLETVGGILGWADAASTVVMEGCVNRGAVSCPSANYAGGLMGTFRQYAANVGECVFICNCANYGDVTGLTVGGLAAVFDANTGWNNGKCAVYNCANYGNLTGSPAGGELLGRKISGSNASIVMDFCNCWAATKNLIPSSSGRAPDFTGTVTAEDEGYTHARAVASLNTSGEIAYWPWVAGQDGRPELFRFVEAPAAGDCIVLFCDWDGTVLKAEQVAAGGAATAPDDPVRESFRFLGWSRDYSSVTGNLIVYAVYGALTYTFTFDSDGGSKCAPQTYNYGDMVKLPVPVREGFEFVCWTENMAYKQFVTCPNYDPNLTAIWRALSEPRVRKLSVVQWNCKSTDGTRRAAVIAALTDALSGRNPDVFIMTGLEDSAAIMNALETAFAGYAFTTHGSNGTGDGFARVIGYRKSRFTRGEWDSIMSASNATTGYIPLHEIGTDNYYVVFDMFSADTKGASTYISSLKSVYDNARAKYPTATCIAGGSYSAFKNDKDNEWSTKYNSDYTQALADLESKTGLTALQAGEDLQWTLCSSAYDPCMVTDVSVAKLENAAVSADPGYLVSFGMGKASGLMIVIRRSGSGKGGMES